MKCSNCNTEFDSKKCPNCRKDPQEPASDFRKRMYTTVAVILFVLSIVSSLLIVDLVKDYNSNTYNKVHNSASSNSNTSNYDNNSDQSTDYDNNDTDSDDDSYNEDNDNDNSDSDDNYSNDIFDDNGNIDDDLKELYNQQIDEYYENYGSSTTVTKYDINGDGVDELILSHGDVDSDWNNDIYDFSDGNISPVGSFRNHVTFFEPEGDDDGVISVWRTMGYQEISQITIDDNGRLNVKTIDEKELSGNSPEYQGNKIETYRLGDYLGEKDGSSEDYDSDTIEYYDMNRIVDTKNWEICVTEAYKTSDDYPNIKVKCTITNTSKSDKRFIMKGNVQAYADYKYYDGTGDWNNFVITSGDTVDTTLEFALTELSVDDIDSTDIYLSIEGTNIWLKSLQN